LERPPPYRSGRQRRSRLRPSGNFIPPPPLQDEWLTGQERQVRDEARTRRHQRWTQAVPLQPSKTPAPDLVQGMQPIFPTSIADTHSTGQLPTVPEGVEPGQLDNDEAITEQSETDAPEGAEQRTRSGRRVRPPNRMNLKTSTKFKGDNRPPVEILNRRLEQAF
jgi:hypothetical protein